MLKNKKQPKGRSRSNIKSTLSQPANFSSRNIENDQQDPPKNKNKRSAGFKNVLRKSGLLILIVAGAVSLFNILTLSSNPKINYLKTDGQTGQLRSSDEYQKYSKEILSSNLLNSNKLTFNEANASNEITKHFPEVNSVSITIPFLSHRPIVNIQPAVATLIIDTGNNAYVVADNGKAIVKASSSQDLSSFNLPVVKDSVAGNLDPANKLLPTYVVNFIKEINAQFSAKNLKITELSLPVNNSELDVKIDGKTYYVKFNLQKDNAIEQSGSALATINYLSKKNINPSQYLDVRVLGRAYYK